MTANSVHTTYTKLELPTWKHSSGDLHSRLKTRKILGVGETDNGDIHRSKFGLAIHQNDHQARRRFVEWAQNEIAVVPDFQKRILLSDEAHFWLNGYVNKQNCRIWSEANPQVYVETPLHPEKLTVWCALWAGGILLQKAAQVLMF
ncbi:transposable element Tc3 transposase [Trichonephila clavipes]|nr:transposable element Tc3 transposase [Trichonephila clavipes]